MNISNNWKTLENNRIYENRWITLYQDSELLAERIPIDSVIVTNRTRKDVGNINSLAESINTVGLMQPIVINENNELVESIDEIISNNLRRYEIFDVDFQRIAVTEEQTNRFNLPRNPDPETLRKLKRDTRARSFVQKHGELFQIEVDALQAYAADEFSSLIQQSVDQFYDEGLHEQIVSEYHPKTINRLVKKNLKSLLSRL